MRGSWQGCSISSQEVPGKDVWVTKIRLRRGGGGGGGGGMVEVTDKYATCQREP